MISILYFHIPGGIPTHFQSEKASKGIALSPHEKHIHHTSYGIPLQQHPTGLCTIIGSCCRKRILYFTGSASERIFYEFQIFLSGFYSAMIEKTDFRTLCVWILCLNPRRIRIDRNHSTRITRGARPALAVTVSGSRWVIWHRSHSPNLTDPAAQCPIGPCSPMLFEPPSRHHPTIDSCRHRFFSDEKHHN